MAQSGYTPILIYASGTASNVPLAANLTSSASGAELALNYADGKLYFKNSSGVVTLLAGSGGGGPAAGSNTQIQFNNSGVFGASANLTWSGTVLSTTGLTATGAITLNTTTNNQSYTTTGAGTITISSGTAGSINNMTIGGTTAAAGTFTNLTYTGTLTGSTGVIAIGTNQIYKDSSGNVGIGTASPSYKLDVAGVVRGTGNIISGDGSAFVFGTGVTSYVSGSSTSNVIDFYTSSTARMRIDSSGNVGIGTSAPLAKLQIKTQTNGNAAFQNSTSVAGGVKINCFNDAGSTSSPFEIDGSTLQFNIASTEKMRIDSSGNVGIGTSSPAGKLEVSGGRSWFTANSELYSIAFRYSSSTGVMYMGATNSVSTPSIQFSNSGGTALATIDYSGNLLLGTSSGTARLVVNGGTSTSQIRWEVNNAAFVNEVSTNAAANAYVYKSNDASYHVWKLSSSEAMRLDSSGNVGIGTSSPTQKLDVNGIGRMRFSSGTGAGHYLDTTGNASRFFVGTDAVTEAWRVYDSIGVANRIYLDSSGNVGIGTSSPSTYSSVYKTVNAIKINDQVTTIGSYYQGGVAQYGFINVSDAVGTTATSLVFSSGSNVERMRIDSSGNVLVTNPAGLGYGTGSGGTVTQATSKSTAVTLNKPTGQITMNAAALAAGASVSFNFINSLLAATDSLVIQPNYGANSQSYTARVTFCGAGGAYINVTNLSGGSLSEAVTLSFAIIKGATA